MKRIILGLVVALFVLAACGGNEKEAKAKDKYEKTKESLEQTEKKNPLRFLTLEGHDRKNLVRKTVITGVITNKAKVASYKDIDVEISFYSKTGTLLMRDHEMIYETIDPGSSQDFKTKIRAPKDSDSVGIKIVRAKAK